MHMHTHTITHIGRHPTYHIKLGISYWTMPWSVARSFNHSQNNCSKWGGVLCFPFNTGENRTQGEETTCPGSRGCLFDGGLYFLGSPDLS